MNDTDAQENPKVQSKVYEVEALDAALFLEVGRTRLSQLTSSGVFSFEKRKVGFRYRNFYDRAELESYVNLRKLGMQAQLRNRVGASAQENGYETSLESTTKLVRAKHSEDLESANSQQSFETSFRFGETDGKVKDPDSYTQAEPKPKLKWHAAGNKKHLKSALDLLNLDVAQKDTQHAFQQTEQRVDELTKNMASIEQLCLKTQLLVKQTFAEIMRHNQVTSANRSNTGALLLLLQDLEIRVAILERKLLRNKKPRSHLKTSQARKRGMPCNTIKITRKSR